jgi:hypothetical protein
MTTKQKSLWDRVTRKKAKPTSAPVAQPQPRQVTLDALPDMGMPLIIQGRPDKQYSLRLVMECGGETYLRLVRYAQRNDPLAQQAVAPLYLVLYAE